MDWMRLERVEIVEAMSGRVAKHRDSEGSVPHHYMIKYDEHGGFHVQLHKQGRQVSERYYSRGYMFTGNV